MPTLPPANTAGVSYVQISAGTYAACAVASDGAAYCWGDNTYGQTGDNSTIPRRQPTRVADGGATWSQISIGNHLSCGVQTDGSGWCWGENAAGQVGDGTLVDRLVPTPIAEPGPWVGLYAYNGFACGLKTDGTAYCASSAPLPGRRSPSA